MFRERDGLVSESRKYVVFPYSMGCEKLNPTVITIPEGEDNNSRFALAYYMREFNTLAMMEDLVLTLEEYNALTESESFTAVCPI